MLALPDGDIAYVDFGNVAEISRANQESLIDAVVHVMNRDYEALRLEDAGGPRLFATGGRRRKRGPVAEGLADVWGDEALESLASTEAFSFRGLTREFNKLLYEYRIRVDVRSGTKISLLASKTFA